MNVVVGRYAQEERDSTAENAFNARTIAKKKTKNHLPRYSTMLSVAPTILLLGERTYLVLSVMNYYQET